MSLRSCASPVAQEATRLDHVREVEHMRGRVTPLEQAIAEAVKLASPGYNKSSTIFSGRAFEDQRFFNADSIAATAPFRFLCFCS